MLVVVYFQTEMGSHSEMVATFFSEALYIECLPALILEAEKQGCIVTEVMLN
jgi:hypothetical protein